MQAAIAALESFYPTRTLTTAELAGEFPQWAVEKIDEKTGIHARHIAGAEECASDLAAAAAQKLFDSGACTAEAIDFLLFCTQTPDYTVPTTACLLQERLGIPRTAGALDFNLGSSGYVYGLGLAQGLVCSGQAANILLLTGDTYTRLVNAGDKSTRTIFSDAATATLIRGVEAEAPLIGPFVYGTDGRGGGNLMVPASGMRHPRTAEAAQAVEDENGNVRSRQDLYMDGGAIFSFTIAVAPPSVKQLLAKSGLEMGDIDLFVFHQANRFMLEHLRKRMQIPAEKFYLALEHGNTASSSIPAALRQAREEGRLAEGKRIMLVGFGPGYSWGAALVRWREAR